jgi:dCTP deaminase
MPVLSDRDIKRRLDDDLVVEPLTDVHLQVQPSSVDLRLGREVKRYKKDLTYIGPDANIADEMTTNVTRPGEVMPVHPHDFLLVPTVEWVEMPDDLQASITGRSSIGRLGIEVHSTAGLIDPGYEGQIVLEISNNSNVTVELRPDMRVAQLVFNEVTSAAERPYGHRADSKYQNQSGAQESLISRDLSDE